MKVLVIFGHPSKRSYTYRILELLKNEILQKNWSIEVSDLYAMDFRSDMSEEEYNREGFSSIELSIPDDVLKEHKKLNEADCVIFLYPVWWSDCPAKLKGWFDRVFSVGYAYKQRDGFPRMKKIRHGVVLCTAGYSAEYLHQIGIAQSMKNIMLDDRMGQRFENKEMIILGGTLETDIVRQQHGDEIRQLLERVGRPEKNS